MNDLQGDENMEYLDYAEEILTNMDKIKILCLKYCQKLIKMCHSKGWKLNPSDIIRNAY
jgi:hypothetical protein